MALLCAVIKSVLSLLLSCESFTQHFNWCLIHWSPNDIKSPQAYWTHLSILAGLKRVLISILLVSNSSNLLSNFSLSFNIHFLVPWNDNIFLASFSFCQLTQSLTFWPGLPDPFLSKSWRILWVSFSKKGSGFYINYLSA